MKRLITATIAAVTITGLGAQAQENIRENYEIMSPELNADGSVTLRLSAPEANSVEVTADWLIRPESMVRDADGVWTYRSAPLKSELWNYRFRVDGVDVNDPSNVDRLRDIGTVTDYFIISADDDSPAALYTAGKVPHGSVTRAWYPSPSLGCERRVSIYTPPGYESSGTRRYPVLYLLHGTGGDEEAWLSLGRAAQILDNLTARGEIKPMIVVMPNADMDVDAAPGEGILRRRPTAKQPGLNDSRFECNFPELMKYVDENYRTVADREHRAIAGLSRGGFHTMHISAAYPDDFGYVGLFSAATRPAAESASLPFYTGFDQKLKRQVAKHPALYYIAIGKDDFLYDDNSRLRSELDSAGMDYVYRESGGGHQWRNWRTYLADFLPRLFH